MLAVVYNDYCRTEHGMLEPAYGANLFIFWWLFSLVQVCGQKAVKYFRRIKFRSWTNSFRHFLPMLSQKNEVDSLHATPKNQPSKKVNEVPNEAITKLATSSPRHVTNGVSGPKKPHINPTVIIEHTDSVDNENCNCLVCAANSDEEFSLSHSYSSSCSSCSSSSTISSPTFSEEEDDEENEEKEIRNYEFENGITIRIEDVEEKMEEKRSKIENGDVEKEEEEDEEEEVTLIEELNIRDEKEDKEEVTLIEELNIRNEKKEEVTIIEEVNIRGENILEVIKIRDSKEVQEVEKMKGVIISVEREVAVERDTEKMKAEIVEEEIERIRHTVQLKVKEEIVKGKEDKKSRNNVIELVREEGKMEENSRKEEKKDKENRRILANQKNEETLKNIEEMLQKDKEVFKRNEEMFQNVEEMFQEIVEAIQKDEEAFQKDEEAFQKDEEAFQKDEEMSQKDEEISQKDKEMFQRDEEMFQKDEVTFQKVREMLKVEVNEAVEKAREMREIKPEVRREEKTDDIKKQVKNSDKMTQDIRIGIREGGTTEQKGKTIVNGSKKEKAHLASEVPRKLTAYSQFSKLPPAPPNSPRRASKVKALATWYEENVIVHSDQVSVKKRDLSAEEPVACPDTYDSNNNKNVVGGLINFFCHKDPRRPRPQPISEARVNVMNLIETFEKRAENNSRHYPFIPLHAERFV